MRVSPVGWFYDTLDKTIEVARWSAEVTHNHPEGIKGAKATAAAIFMARNGSSKEEIKVMAFMEGEDFEDVIRTAVSLGGDCDTLTCIAGGMAEAMYDVLEDFVIECRKRLPEDALEVIDSFYEFLRE